MSILKRKRIIMINKIVIMLFFVLLIGKIMGKIRNFCVKLLQSYMNYGMELIFKYQ